MFTMPNLIIGIGNPLLDISAHVDASFLERYKLKPNDAILAQSEHLPIYQELQHAQYKATYTAGGSVQNSLRVVQWILGMPKVCTFFGCVGQDEYAEILEQKATEDGVNVCYQCDETAPTGTCAVLVNGHRRSLCANLGAAQNFKEDHLNLKENWSLIEGSQYYYVSGFFLSVSPGTIMQVAKYAHSQKRTFIMNLSAPFIAELHSKDFMNLMPYIDIIFGNETEAEAFAKTQSWPIDNLGNISVKMADLPKQDPNRKRIVIITQGADPVILAHDGCIRQFPVPKLAEDRIVDTNGAGDAFVGGFLAQLLRQKPWDVCIKCGTWAAAEIIQRNGCTYEGTATFEEDSTP